MSEAVNLLKRADDLSISNQLSGYSKVEIYAGQDDDGNEIIYSAGDNTGKILQIKNEFGSQQMAQNVLARVRGFQYQPFTASSAHLDPAVEIGDGVTVNGIYSGIFVKATTFGSLMTSDLSAPTDDEIEHEFNVETATDRQYTRFVQATKASLKLTNNAIEAEVAARTASETEIRATLAIHATEISARVTKTGGSNSSFGWTLESDHWSVYSNSQEVFRITSSGASVKGQIKATSGFIGSENNGFNITSNAIYNNISYYGGTQSNGVYVGTNGIQLGQGFRVNSSGAVTATSLNLNGGSININNTFRVDSSGNLYASSGTFSGNVYAKNISYGGNAGYFSGSGISDSTITTSKTSNGINTSLGYANFSNDVFNNRSTANYVRASIISASSIYVSNLKIWKDEGYANLSWGQKYVITKCDIDVERSSTGIYVTNIIKDIDGEWINYLAFSY